MNDLPLTFVRVLAEEDDREGAGQEIKGVLFPDEGVCLGMTPCGRIAVFRNEGDESNPDWRCGEVFLDDPYPELQGLIAKYPNRIGLIPLPDGGKLFCDKERSARWNGSSQPAN